MARAARCIVQASVDPTVRHQASRFLEEWTETPESWEVYAKWLSSYRYHQHQQQESSSVSNTNDPELLSMQILCLTMLQSKIRKELRRNQQPVASTCTTWQHPSVATVRAELWEYLKQLRPDDNEDRLLISPCCICNAAMMVRGADDMMAEFIKQAVAGAINSNNNNNNMDNAQRTYNLLLPSNETTLRLMACIPGEMEACQDLTNSDITAELSAHIESILDTVNKGLMESHSTLLPACQVLQTWIEIAHISLSQLNTPTFGGTQAVLPTLIHLLSNNGQAAVVYNELVLQTASRALTNAILVVSDHCSPDRAAAAESFWTAVSKQHFIIHPLQIATQQEWHDASHALASLLSTFVVEQVDDLVSHPADIGLQILLDLQSHPHTSVALVPLEIWLTIQEIPTSDRHDDWKLPLYRKLVEVLVTRIAYPRAFISWEEELELDSSDFLELRRLVSDVLSSCYFLMRGEMVQMLIQQIQTATHWTCQESALFCFSQISKDLCARCKSRAPNGTIVGKDRDATCQALLQLLQQLMTTDAPTTYNQSKDLLAANVNFLGTFSPAWNAIGCPPAAIVHLMMYLQVALKMLPIESAKAIRALCICCLEEHIRNAEDIDPKELGDDTQNILPAILKSIRDSMEAVLCTTEVEAMTTVAEGATRLLTKIADSEIVRQALTNDLVRPVLREANIAVHALPQSNSLEDWSTPAAQLSSAALLRYLEVIKTIARFCDAPQIPAMGIWFIQEVGSFMDSVHRRVANSPIQSMVVPKWIMIQQQVLRNAPPHHDDSLQMLTSTIPTIVQVLEQTHDPSALKYISTAVENFGGKTDQLDESFQQLLVRVATAVTGYSNIAESPELLQSFFDCLQRFLLYCPRALCYNTKFGMVVNFSVDAVSAIADKEAIRAALIFLSQLFGWTSLRLPVHSLTVMQEVWSNGTALKDLLLRNGQRLVEACFKGLAGGSQMLWPAYSNCVFSIVQSFVANPSSHHANPAHATPSSGLDESVLQQWLTDGMRSTLTSDSDVGLCNQVISILLSLSRQGPKSGPRAKMLLTDFAKIKKGEVKVDALVAYTLP